MNTSTPRLFRFNYIVRWADPPATKKLLKPEFALISQRLLDEQTLVDSKFAKGIVVTFVTAPEESSKPYSYSIDDQLLFCTMKINGNLLYELSEADTTNTLLQKDCARISEKVLAAICEKYKLKNPLHARPL